MKECNLLDIFTISDLESAAKLPVSEIQEKIIVPNMGKINRVTGQENDSRYWAYLLHFHSQRVNNRRKT